jgi:hypothetical protein
MSAYIVAIPGMNAQYYFFISGSSFSFMKITIITGLLSAGITAALLLYFGEIGVYLGIFISVALRSFSLELIGKLHWEVQPFIHFSIYVLSVTIIIYSLSR